ncbi:MAG TPA: asparagine synthase-related protein [Vicinamibacteria bacterium]
MSHVRIAGALDHNFAWTGSQLAGPELSEPDAPLPVELRGAYAGVGTTAPHRHRLVRDPMGLNKLFWAAGPDGSVVVSARPCRLVAAGCRFETIQAVPAGAAIDLDFSSRTARVAAIAGPARRPDPSANAYTVEAAAEEIRRTLDEYVAGLARAAPEAQAFVCLSGGLDSTGVAVLARGHFRTLTAVSFDIAHPDGRPSEDRVTAERLARDLALPLRCVTVRPDELLDQLDGVLAEGVDWRDFNVHAALVNAALAAGVAAARDGQGPALVLTGDLMNEFLVDYLPETYRGKVYYRLPRLAPTELQDALVKGLASTHREVGPFERCGLALVQPYAAAAHLYLNLPAPFLLEPERKQRLTRLVFGDAVPPYVFTRGKTRAQMGDADGSRGVLALCVDRGLDDAWLRRRFAALHQVEDLGVLDRFLRGGRYRSGVPLAEAHA